MDRSGAERADSASELAIGIAVADQQGDRLREVRTLLSGDNEEFRARFSQVGTDARTRALRWSEPRWKDHVGSHSYDRETDPFLAYLEGLSAWDGKARIEGLLSALLGAPNTKLTRWASRQPWFSAVRRALVPAAQVEEVVVLIGAQGVGKSTFYRSMIPPDMMARWYTSQFAFSNDLKRMIEATFGKVIVECGELAGANRAERENIKSYITIPFDNGVRHAYARYVDELPRRSILVGTSNDANCLPNDPSGNRRFVPIAVKRVGSVKAMVGRIGKVRPQLWAEALHRVRAGEECWLYSPELETATAEAAENYRHTDSDPEDRVRALTIDSGTTRQIADAMGFGEGMLSRSDQVRISGALRLNGWNRVKEWNQQAGKQVRVWRKGT